MNKRMQENGLSVNRLAIQLDVSYEYVRKIARGLSTPSGRTLVKICDVLQLDHHEMERLVVADKIRRHYGKVVLDIVGKDERTEQLECYLGSLTDEQIEFLRAGALYWVRKNRKKNAQARRTRR